MKPQATDHDTPSQTARRRLRQQAVEHFGTFDFDPDWDYKAERRAARSASSKKAEPAPAQGLRKRST